MKSGAKDDKKQAYQEIIMSEVGLRRAIEEFDSGYRAPVPFKLGTRTPEINPHLMITSLREMADAPDLTCFPIPRFEFSPFRGATLDFRSAAKMNQYLRLYDIKRARRCKVNIGEYYIRMRLYLDFLKKLERVFSDMLGSLDTDVVLKATAPLGFVKPNHFDMDEKGVFGIKRNFRFPAALVEHTIEYFSKLLPKEKVDQLSMKRGTNLGWPTPKAGRTRDESDLLLISHAAYAEGCKQHNLSLAQALDQLQSIYGPCFTIAGERYQETERILPNIYEGSTIISDGGSLRTRGIYFSPKFMVIWNRPVVKTVLKALLASDYHIQDRDILRKNLGKRWDYSLSLDVSAFDQSFGYGAQNQAHQIIAQLASRAGLGDVRRIFQDLETEFNVPNILPTARETYISSGGNVLSSGLAATSLIGTFTSHMIMLYLMNQLTGLTYQELDNSHSKSWVGYSWGDDVVLCCDRSLVNKIMSRWNAVKSPSDIIEIVKQLGKTMELKFDSEPTRKFLGQYYDISGYTSDTAIGGIPVGRWIQRQFFPERLKQYPFDRIGLLARLYMLGDNSVSKEVLHRIRSEFRIGVDVEFSGDSIHDMLPFVRELVEYADSIKELDDVLNTFTHGLDEFDSEFSLADMFGDEFVNILGAQQLRVDDVNPWLADKENASKMSKGLRNALAALSESANPVQFQLAISEIARIYNTETPYLASELYY